MGKEVKIIYFLVIFLLIFKLTTALCICGDYDAFGNPCPCPGGGGEGTGGHHQQEIVWEDVDYSDPDVDLSEMPADEIAKHLDKLSKYGRLGDVDRAKLVEALKSKGYNIESLEGDLTGAKIEGDNLVFKDGSKIDLTTGKPITVETDGSKVTYFDDGEGTTCNTNKICSSGNCICDPSKECL